MDKANNDIWLLVIGWRTYTLFSNQMSMFLCFLYQHTDFNSTPPSDVWFNLLDGYHLTFSFSLDRQGVFSGNVSTTICLFKTFYFVQASTTDITQNPQPLWGRRYVKKVTTRITNAQWKPCPFVYLHDIETHTQWAGFSSHGIDHLFRLPSPFIGHCWVGTTEFNGVRKWQHNDTIMIIQPDLT